MWVSARKMAAFSIRLCGSQAAANALKELLNEDTPLTSGGPVRQQVGGILRGVLNRPPRTTMYFLFRGNAPLELVVHARQAISVVAQLQ